MKPISSYLQAKKYADQEVTRIVNRETDTDAMSRQAAVDSDGVDKINLKQRLDDDHTKVITQISDNAKQSDLKINRKRNDTRRNRFKKRNRYSLPAGFSWQNAPISIYSDGLNFYTNFDVANFKTTGGKTIYHSVSGSDSNSGLTEALPVKTLLKAQQLASTSGDTILNIDPVGTILRRDASWNAAKIQKTINVIARNNVKFICGDLHTYTKTTGATNVYQVARSNVAKVVDITFDDLGLEYAIATSIADCDTKEGSWYTDGATIYVHAIGHNSPDNNKVFVLLKADNFYANSDTQAVSLYVEGFSIYGGGNGNLTVDATTNGISVYGKRMNFLYASANTGIQDALDINGADYAFFQECIAAYSDKDGFNYTANNIANATKAAPKFIEVDCQGFGNGLKNSIAGSENTNNGSTAHLGSAGIRINGTYYNNMGSNVCDVQTNTKSVNLGCTAFDSACNVDSSYSSNFCAQQNGAEMWLDGCVAFGSKYDIYPVSNTTMHIWNTEYDTSQGGGIFDILNQL